MKLICQNSRIVGATISLFYFFIFFIASAQNQEFDKIYQKIPFKMDKIKAPAIPDYSVSIVDFGAKADGVTLNTKAINDAIKSVAQKGGGRVVIPEGLWLTGPIELLSNIELYTEKNSLILFTADHSQYPIVSTIFEGLATYRCQSPIYSRNASNIAITGYGVFDGSGDSWRPVKKDKMTDGQWRNLLKKGGVVDTNGRIWYPSQSSYKGSLATTDFNVPKGVNTDAEWDSIRDWLRPVLLSLIECDKVHIEGVTFKNSPSWCIHPLMCKDVVIDKVKVFNPWYSQNGDALDLESCNRVLVSNCVFDAGDDAICLKSGKDEQGRKRGVPCQNIVVINNTVLHGHGGFVVGSEMSGGVKNIFVSNCSFLGTDVGLRFKSNRGRGGVVENIFIENINMINIPNEAILFNLYYGGKSREEEANDSTVEESAEIYPVTEETPCFRNIDIKDVTCYDAGRAMQFKGLPEMRIDNVKMENINVMNCTDGIELDEVSNADFKNINITLKKDGEKMNIQNCSRININGREYNKIGKKNLMIGLSDKQR